VPDKLLLKKRRTLPIILCLCLFLSFPDNSHAAIPPDYPVLAYSIALPFAENDQINLFPALLQPFWDKVSPLPLTFRHYPGRGGAYAWNSLLGQKADGSILSIISLPSFQLQDKVKDSLYSQGEISPICIFAYAPGALWVPEESPFTTLADLLNYAGKQETPVRIAGNSRYTDQHMGTLLLARAAGVTLQYLPYTSTTAAAGATKDHTALACWGYALIPENMPKMRPLAVAFPERSPVFPDLPTFRELGLEVTSGQYLGLGMPFIDDNYGLEIISEFFMTATNVPEALDLLSKAGFIPTPVQFTELRNFMDNLDSELDIFIEEYPLFNKR
jgi:tripartite-type tricarboxylate transporter receptor subunit TctC